MTMGTRRKPTNRIRPGASRIVSSVLLRSFGPRHPRGRRGPAVLRLISGGLRRVGDGGRGTGGRAGEVVRDRGVEVLARLGRQRRVEVELLVRGGLEVGRGGLGRRQGDGA